MYGQRLVAHKACAIHQKRDAGNMIEMGMRDEDMVDHAQLSQAEFAHTRACVDQHVVIQQHGGGAEVSAYAAATAEYPEFHRQLSRLIIWLARYFVLKSNTPSQSAAGGLLRKCAARSA